MRTLDELSAMTCEQIADDFVACCDDLLAIAAEIKRNIPLSIPDWDTEEQTDEG